MCKRIIFLAVAALGVMFISLNTCYAMRLLTKEEALKKVLGSDVEIKTETKELAESKLSKIKERLGGELVHYQQGSKSKEVNVAASVDFYFAVKNGQNTSVAIIDQEPGKWGPVEFIIGLDLQGAVTRVEVLSYEEKRGQPIARHSFMSQFEGKTSKDRI